MSNKAFRRVLTASLCYAVSMQLVLGCSDTGGKDVGPSSDSANDDETPSNDDSVEPDEDSSTNEDDPTDDESESSEEDDPSETKSEDSTGDTDETDDSSESSDDDSDSTDDDSSTDESSDDDSSDTDEDDELGCDWGADDEFVDNVPPSLDPPGGLELANVPMFVSIGWDDNGFEDGMEWILDFQKDRRNPSGTGDPCTFDGMPTRSTFFNSSMYALKEQWSRAYREHHELGNHTVTHAETLQQNPDRQVWIDEMSQCNAYQVDEVGVPADELRGFRTPFLSHSEATFEAMAEIGFLYECSVEHFKELSSDHFVWPYTLDGGKHSESTFNTTPHGSYPGLWEFPVYQILRDDGGTNAITGFDYNMWAQAKMSKADVLTALKVTLEHRLRTNRAPFLIGAHTDYYSEFNDAANNASPATYTERREAFEDFLTWAVETHPEVRIVRHIDILRWMREPVGLDGTRGQSSRRHVSEHGDESSYN